MDRQKSTARHSYLTSNFPFSFRRGDQRRNIVSPQSSAPSCGLCKITNPRKFQDGFERASSHNCNLSVNGISDGLSMFIFNSSIRREGGGARAARRDAWTERLCARSLCDIVNLTRAVRQLKSKAVGFMMSSSATCCVRQDLDLRGTNHIHT